MATDYASLRQNVLDAASKCARRGVAYSQQMQVLQDVAASAGGASFPTLDLAKQQAILTCWHDLFREGLLSWGYDLDNPGPPFFHLPDRASGPAQPRD